MASSRRRASLRGESFASCWRKCGRPLHRLARFPSIAWDFDDTLLGHRHSPAFWSYIAGNPYGQTHHIVTMRSHGLELTMFDELRTAGSLIGPAQFQHVLGVPYALYEQYQAAGRTLPPLHPYRTFKGEACRLIGAEALVDDMEGEAVSASGCQLYGIAHIHPDDLGPNFRTP